MESDSAEYGNDGVSIRKRAREIHIAFKALPEMEHDFASSLIEISNTSFQERGEVLALRIMLEHIAMIRMELSRAFRGVSGIQRWLENSEMTDLDFEKEIQQHYGDFPRADAILASVKNRGGVRQYFESMSKILLERHTEYGQCMRRIKDFKQDEDASVSELAIDLFDVAPGSTGTPGSTYFFLCAGGPLAWAVTAAVVVIVIVAKDDSGREDPPEPDPEDPDAGV